MLEEKMEIKQIEKLIKEDPNGFVNEINKLLIGEVKNFTDYFDNKPDKPYPESQFKKYFDCSSSTFLNILDANNIEWITKRKKFFFITSEIPKEEIVEEQVIADGENINSKSPFYDEVHLVKRYKDNEKHYLKFSTEVMGKLDDFCDKYDYILRSHIVNMVIETGINHFEKGDKNNE